MDYNLAALKLFCGQLKNALHVSSSPPALPALSIHGIRFQRVWLQGVLVSGVDEGRFLLDDGSGVIELSLQARLKPQDWKSGMYVLVVGPYMADNPPQIKLAVDLFELAELASSQIKSSFEH
ncbi:hypothetical protein HPP92_000799 [Vanilla planifolia]|uniref:RecQ-mediated genome instability protein 2 n=1 Tax=Vanilla planifolia TaxID=51239 RepID=A0A835SAT9_VANPL|nr:hypothetical protein HPP92_000799 [Vanilla planifolia]